MAEEKVLHMSSGPHVRSRLKTSSVMLGVIISLMPATIIGIWNFGPSALGTVLASVVAAVLTEYLFDRIVHKENTVKDGSAVVTGILLALVLPNGTPLYIPIIGAVFAILVVKCFFGGLGKNFMNPALAARCFLLISFGTQMTRYEIDGVSSATPLANLAAGGNESLLNMFLGRTNGVIGCSILGLLIGGIFLWAIGGITWQIPVSVLASFTLFMAIFGGHGLSPVYLLQQICGGGVVMAAFFMATDPVTSPVAGRGQLIYGCLVGILSGLFRVYGSSADSVSYAVIISNLFTPLIDMMPAPKPYAYRKRHAAEDAGQKKPFRFPKPALILCVITLIAGLLLSTVYGMTKAQIALKQEEEKTASYKEVLPDADKFSTGSDLKSKVAALDGKTYGTSFGKVTIDGAVEGKNSSGDTVGYVIAVTSGDGFNGDISLSAGILTDGTVNGISFTTLNETAGMGMKAEEPAFKDQFAGKNVDSFVLNKQGGSTEDNQIDSISGASITSGAVVNAVNAAVDFYRNQIAK